MPRTQHRRGGVLVGLPVKAEDQAKPVTQAPARAPGREVTQKAEPLPTAGTEHKEA